MATSKTPPEPGKDTAGKDGTARDVDAALDAAADAASEAGTELLDRVRHNAHQAVDRLADTAEPHVQRLQQGVQSAGKALHARADDLRQTGEVWSENLRSTVRENPLASVCAAFAVGMLVARLTRR